MLRRKDVPTVRKSAMALVPILLLTACANAGARTAAETHADPRGYEAGVCAHGYVTANVGGRNQNGEFVHTPNFALTGAGRCGIEAQWWFRPYQTLEINARTTRGEWRRFFRAIAVCAPKSGRPDRRWCVI